MLIVLGMLFLSCLDIDRPKIRDVEQKSPFYVYVEIDGKEYIDVEMSVCFSRMYRNSKEYIGPTTQYEDKNIKECDKIVGNSPDEYNLYTTWKTKFRNWLLRFQ